jgi:Flp pilus assembly protein TadD
MAIARGADDENFWPNFYFAEMLAKEGHYQEAKERLETAVQIKPNETHALNNLAWLLSTCQDKKIRDGGRAVQLAEKACQLTNDGSAQYLTTLAAAYAEAGRFDDAIATIQKAGGLAQQMGQTDLFSGDAQLLELFTDHQSYTEKSK